jgi:hypothetical protein
VTESTQHPPALPHTPAPPPTYTHTHSLTHTARERERERETPPHAEIDRERDPHTHSYRCRGWRIRGPTCKLLRHSGFFFPLAHRCPSLSLSLSIPLCPSLSLSVPLSLSPSLPLSTKIHEGKNYQRHVPFYNVFFPYVFLMVLHFYIKYI